MRLLALGALILAALAPAALAEGCIRDPLVTVGAPAYPAPGAYGTLDCSATRGVPVVRVEIAHAIPAGSCLVVPPVFVLGAPVPGTGEAHCPPGGAPFVFETPWNARLPDRGVAVCGPASCASAGGGDAIALCAAFVPVTLSVGVASVRVSCAIGHG